MSANHPTDDELVLAIIAQRNAIAQDIKGHMRAIATMDLDNLDEAILAVRQLGRELRLYKRANKTLGVAVEKRDEEIYDPRAVRRMAIFHSVVLDGMNCKEVGDYHRIGRERTNQIVRNVARKLLGPGSYRRLWQIREEFCGRTEGRPRPGDDGRFYTRGATVSE